MPTIVAHHKITKGAQHWLTSPKRKEFFGPTRGHNPAGPSSTRRIRPGLL